MNGWIHLSHMRGIPFDTETYIRSVESYTSGTKSVDEIVKETGISESTLYNRLREFRRKGHIDFPKVGPITKLTQQLYDELADIKKAHPNYGRRRLKRELLKTKEFAGQPISEQSIWRALRQLNLQLPPKKGDSTKQKSRRTYSSRATHKKNEEE